MGGSPSAGAPSTSAPKIVLTPQQTAPASAFDRHSHTGFIVAIVAVALITIVVSVLAYLAYAGNNRSLGRLSELEGQSAALADQASQLQAELDARGEPIPYFYTTPIEKPFEMAGAGALHAIDPVSGEDRIVATFPDGEYYQVYAHPRRGWDGRIFLSRELGLSPNLQLYTFDVESGTALEQWPDNDALPSMRQAIALSPDQTMIAALYDNPNDAQSLGLPDGQRKVILFNLLSGKRLEYPINNDDWYLTDTYNDKNGAQGLFVYFSTDTCANYAIYRQTVDESGNAVVPRAYAFEGIACWRENAPS